MTITKAQAMITSALGYSNYKELLDSGISITCKEGWKGYYISVFHSDPFYSSYSKASIIMIASDISLSSLEVATVKKRIKAKQAQERKLDNIRYKAEHLIIDFIEDSFRIPRKLIKIEDISWEPYCAFIIGGVTFRYQGTISDEYFSINETVLKNYKDTYDVYKGIIAFYMAKEPYLKNNHI